MASEQLRREDVTDDQCHDHDTVVERDRVPKMTTHYENLAEKAREEQHSPVGAGSERTPKQHNSPVGVGSERNVKQHSSAVGVGSETNTIKQQKEQGKSAEIHSATIGPSLDDISDMRAMAQQNSLDFIMNADTEQYYEKAKEMGVSALHKAKEAKDYTGEKLIETKDMIASRGQSAANYVAVKAKEAKDTTLDTTKGAAVYVGEKATAARDAAVQSGKMAAEYVGKVAVEVKDQAVVAGWVATHYTAEKVAGATKSIAGATSSVAGYTGEKAVAAKDTFAKGDRDETISSTERSMQ